MGVGLVSETSFPWILALRILIAAATLVVSPSLRWARRVAFVGSAIASFATGALAWSALFERMPVEHTLFLHRASGFALTYPVDEPWPMRAVKPTRRHPGVL